MPIRMIFFWQFIFCGSVVITWVDPGEHFASPFSWLWLACFLGGKPSNACRCSDGEFVADPDVFGVRLDRICLYHQRLSIGFCDALFKPTGLDRCAF